MGQDNIFSITIVILVFISAFFSAAETALTTASRPKIYKMMREGSRRAKKVEALRKDKDRLLSAILLGNNVVNILASALATSVSINYFGQEGEGLVVATLVMTIIVLIFGEVLPKTYALQNAEKVALMVAPFCIWLVKFLSPVTRAVQVIVVTTLHVLRLGGKKGYEMSGADELRGVIELHHGDGVVGKSHKDMLDSILDLKETEVYDVMVHRKKVFSLDIEQPAQQLIEKILNCSHSRIPLWQEQPENIIGLIHVRDLLRVLPGYEGDRGNFDIMKIAKEPWFVPETTKLGYQLNEFRKKRNHFAFVVDEYGDFVGIVTLEDILEEIVGQIEDEHDTSRKGIKKIAEGVYMMEGEATIRDINRELEWNLPDDEASTLAGLIVNEAGMIPEEGQEFEFFHYRFTILKKKNNQLMRIQVVRLKKDEQ